MSLVGIRRSIAQLDTDFHRDGATDSIDALIDHIRELEGAINRLRAVLPAEEDLLHHSELIVALSPAEGPLADAIHKVDAYLYDLGQDQRDQLEDGDR